jgi:hypothetical protein
MRVPGTGLFAMTDFERRLRAAMAAAAEPPPDGLLAGIRRRHRRHVRRAGAACVAAVVITAIAVPLATRARPAAPSTSPGGSGPAAVARPAPGGSRPARAPSAAPGTLLRDCTDNNNQTLDPNWEAASVRAGPVWFIYARLKSFFPAGLGSLNGNRAAVSVLMVAVTNGRTVVVTGAPAARGHFTFLSDFYGTMDQGAGWTFAGCPAGPAGHDIPESYAPRLTLFGVGYTTDGTHCFPLEIRALPAGRKIVVGLSVTGGTCAS